MNIKVAACAAILCVDLVASVTFAGFDINHTVTRVQGLDQIDIFFRNRNAEGMYPSMGNRPTGTKLYGATIGFTLSGDHRAYFRIVTEELGDRVDLINAVEQEGTGWFRMGAASTTRIGGALPDSLWFPVGTSPWGAGVNALNVSWRLDVDQPGIGLPADSFPGLHVARLYVDPFTEVRLHGFLTEVGLGESVSISPSSPHIIPPIPEPGLAGVVALGALLLRRR